MAAVGGGEVAGIHRAGDVDGEDHVAGGFFELDGFADAFGAGEGRDEERPDEERGEHLEAAAAQDDRAGLRVDAGGLGDAAEERHAQRLDLFAARRQEAPDQPGQRQEREGEGRGEGDHAGAGVWVRTQSATVAARPGTGAGSGA